MNEREIREMQRRIEEGIRIAQERLWERAGREGQALVIVKDGEIREIVPEAKSGTAPSSTASDPLHQHLKR